MKMNHNVIVSAERVARNAIQERVNAAATNKLHHLLHERGIAFVPARGCYNGHEERSIVALIKDSDDYQWLLDLAFGEFEQESVLVVELSNGMIARLHYRDGRIERLGMMERVPEHVARSRKAWTRVTRYMDVGRPFDFWSVNHEDTTLVEAFAHVEQVH